MQGFDFVVIVDLRLPGAEARSLAGLLDAMTARGQSVGLISVMGPLADPRRHVARPLGARLKSGRVRWLATPGPIEAEVALVHHLAPLLADPDRITRVDARKVLIRVDQPIRPPIDLDAVLERASWFFGRRPALLAADSRVAASLPASADIVDGFWPPPAVAQPAAEAAPGQPRLVGYPPPPATDLEALEVAWLEDADGETPAEALATATALLAPVLTARETEALASGVPLVSTGPFAAEWQPCCVPLETFLAAAADERRQHLAAARAETLQQATALAPETWLDRLEAVVGPGSPPRPSLRVRAEEQAPARVLFVSPNGVGMGHLTRQLAIARRLPPAIRPVFLSLSQAVHVVERFGFSWEHAPGPAGVGIDTSRWTSDFAQRLGDAIAFYDARAIVFDGNHPYRALCDARQGFLERPFIWIRRGLWRKDAGWDAIRRGDAFDLVIEPGEIASRLDRGVTSERGDARRVGPVTLLGPDELLSRDDARAALEIPPGALAVLVQLGSGNNFDTRAVLDHVLDACLSIRDCHVRVVRWLISSADHALTVGPRDRVRSLRGFPLCRYAAAFDFAISAAGYNSTHELLAAGLPAIFVPNENPIMDEQEARALHAERLGAAYLARAGDPARLLWAIDAMRDPGRRAAMRRRMAALPSPTGAAETAAIVALHALSLQARGDGPRVPSAGPHW